MKSGITGIARKVPDRLRGGRHWLAGKYREVPLALAELRAKLAGRDAGVRSSGVNPENIIWIFSSSGRSGSTWLRSMMGEMPRHRVWEEPMVGRLFGDFYRRAQTANLRSASFIMGNPIRKGWIRSIRNFVLDGARYAQPMLGPQDYLVVKEPNGSVGAPLLMEALPESRMVLLVRDPRDVVASTLDGAREGNWLYEWKDESGWKREALPDNDPDSFVRNRSSTYIRQAGKAKEAFDAHKGRKVLVRYEDLRADTLGEMRRLYAALEIPVDEKELARAVEKHSWENIPEKKKGEGKFYRKASPGGWQEDLTPEQVETVERITAPLLNEFYTASGNQRLVGARQRRASKRPSRGRRKGAAARTKKRNSPRDRANLAHSVETGSGGINSENIIWIFGAGRTGSSWLTGTMEEMKGQTIWREPLVGSLFGDLYYKRADHRRGSKFVLGGKRGTWVPAVRSFVLQVANAKHPHLKRDEYLIIKEPNGSIGAPLLMEALPESRMVLLVRDPRDVVASSMDMFRKGSFKSGVDKITGAMPDEDPDAYAEIRANVYLQYVGKAKEAFDAHKGRKALLRYEDLRADTLGEMKRLYAALEIPVEEKELTRAVQKHSWENIPERKKGEGKFYRKATPGGWQEDLTPEQARAVEKIAAPLLEEFYPESAL